MFKGKKKKYSSIMHITYYMSSAFSNYKILNAEKKKLKIHSPQSIFVFIQLRFLLQVLSPSMRF